MENKFNILKTTNLSIGYGKKILAENINLSLARGRLTALMGPNGSGKSTLIKTLVQLTAPLAGDIIINDKNLLRMHPAELAFEIAVVLTDPVMVADLTVFELVSYGRYPHTGWLGRLSAADIEVVQKSIRKTGMKGFENRSFDSLSDGEKQRVLVAKGLAQQSPVLILDEPSSHLDIRNRLEMFRLLKQLTVEENITVLFSTHEPDLVRQYTDYLWLFDGKGRVRAGKTEEIISSGGLETVFGIAGKL